jgi:NAD(P)-dependent dehydrogenase (short-subunit alcohol dehydrogenase family)
MNPSDGLQDRVALVVGGTSGIGLEIARALQATGAQLAVASRGEDRGRAAAAKLGSTERPVRWFGFDVQDSGSVDQMVVDVVDVYGSIDVLVNCAGTVAVSDFQDITDAQWDEVINVNLRGVFYCCRAVGRHMLKRRAGSIVNVASISGMIVNRPQPQSTYNISKAGVIMLTKSLAAEWAPHGIRVNAVSPGYINTEMTGKGLQNQAWSSVWLDMTPLGRVGEPSEVSAAVVYLASDASSYVTGSNLVIDGGYTLW